MRICGFCYLASEDWSTSVKNIPSDAVGNDRLSQILYFIVDYKLNEQYDFTAANILSNSWVNKVVMMNGYLSWAKVFSSVQQPIDDSGLWDGYPQNPHNINASLICKYLSWMKEECELTQKVNTFIGNVVMVCYIICAYICKYAICVYIC